MPEALNKTVATLLFFRYRFQEAEVVPLETKQRVSTGIKEG